ncbi:replication initiator [Phycicoccus sp. Soil802]|uniref:replication initiator n=1 Tax=Phycicoccus sp. Soil802 TaxID=1736414 RepID=UPI0009E6891E|nr:replication initiator [Phycicoccus sp. Soil802]
MTTPRISNEMIRELAVKEAVCVRPVMRVVTDRLTKHETIVPIPCGSTRESVCPSCATKARWLRMTQCAEGWHLESEPEDLDRAPAAEAGQGQLNDESDQDDPSRLVRSTRRRSDVVDLPTRPTEPRTIGQTFSAPNGRTYRPSMFITLTLPSYGKVLPGVGTPVKSGTYNYRRAALDALHFPRLLDRWMQNLRRCAGFRVQYFGAVEAQRRLAPHFHVAIRGAVPRATIKTVTRATYLQLWWPQMSQPVYVERVPVWDGDDYRDPDTGFALPTWEKAVGELADDPDGRPAHVMRFGAQTDVKGILSGTPDADRAVRYLTKYLTKSVAETYADPHDAVAAYERHIDRLWEEVRWLPCSPECANWLRFGTQPRLAGPGLTPGQCPSKAHDREHLGVGGRRVQVSRHWSGKTLSEHKADRAAVVRAVLEEAGIEAPDARRMSTEVLDDTGSPRFVWDELPVNAHDYARVVMRSVTERRRRRAEYERARQLVGSAGPPVENNSATCRDVGE